MYIYMGIALAIIMVYFILSKKVGSDYEVVIEAYKDNYALMFMAPVSLYLIDRFKIMERLYGQVSKVQQKMISLYGNKIALQKKKMNVAQLISLMMIS